MESPFQINLALCRAHTAHRPRVPGPRQKVFRRRYPRPFRQAAREKGSLVIASFPQPLSGTGDRNEQFRRVLPACLTEEAVHGARHTFPVKIGIFPAPVIFKAVQRAGYAPVSVDRHAPVIEVRPRPAVGAVLLLRLHRFAAFHAHAVPHRDRHLRALLTDQCAERLHRPVADGAAPRKEQVQERRRRLHTGAARRRLDPAGVLRRQFDPAGVLRRRFDPASMLCRVIAARRLQISHLFSPSARYICGSHARSPS